MTRTNRVLKFQSTYFSYVPSKTGTYLNFTPALVLTTVMKRKTQQIMHNIIPPASYIWLPTFNYRHSIYNKIRFLLRFYF
jgi:hypothetical protein